MTTSALAQKARGLLSAAVEKAQAPVLLFSGGLDTLLIAHLASRKKGLAAVTVAVPGQSRDEIFADRAAKHLGLTHVWVRPEAETLLGALPQTVKGLKTFDPMTLRNTVATHLGLLMARELNASAVMTGDGADELFAGYSFFHDKPPDQLGPALRQLWKTMSFATVELGESLGLEVRTPYLQPALREFAAACPPEALVEERAGRRHGKAVLRRAFEGELPEDLLWREKCPAEFGSGTTVLTAVLDKRVSDADFRREGDTFLKSDGIRLRDKEHLYYYKLYRSQFGPPPKAAGGERTCPDCGSVMPNPESHFCALCGAWPVP